MKTTQQNDTLRVASPGRINIIGEHVDYNDGYVLPAAIDKCIYMDFKANGSPNKCTITSKGFSDVLELDLNNLQKSEQGWHNYIAGVLFEISQLTDGLKGFDCQMESTVPAGSGVSSSAALECGLAFGVNQLFQLGLDQWQIIKLSQRAEHNFVGTKCGIMDQFASVMGKEGHTMFLDCNTLEFDYIPTKIDPYVILMLNTNVTHNLSDSGYNTRREESTKALEMVAQHFGVAPSYRNITLAMLKEYEAQLGDVLYRRASYVVEENERVKAATKVLKENNLVALGELLYQTHDGLSNKYEVSCKELDFLVEFSKNEKEVLGARMMGGGFGGCTLNIIHKDALEDYVARVAEAYQKEFGIALSHFVTVPSPGTVLV